ncbi:winged helix DNA-binding domain-containing protein [Actinokineospora globicatena]|uniref:winged helix DNA-binding domain-containing protein n=1 Tax=Actinokineospora globicatena TaxID=103729 RepID=UPI002556C5F9|nr:winged helix DNA-binding domain-containing protein [Actinokineospora globicatena]MCP2303274.1 Winged helix DNA-binding domain-containing protein [Actinokineospora globicatena]
MTTPVLTRRALNRALLARQFLLERVPLSPLEAVTHLVGMQAQAPNPPYVGLWSRLAGFAFADLAELLSSRRVVRLALMRSTIHLVASVDAEPLRAVLGPVFERGFRSTVGRAFDDVDHEQVAAMGAEIVAGEPLTAAELGRRLAVRWPGHEPDRLAALVRTRVGLVQVPPRGLWGSSGQARHTTLGAWLGEGAVSPLSPDVLVRRYLAAFGPASPADAQAWSGLTGLREVFERQPDLLVFHDESGRVLYDLPEAPRPPQDTPAPVRLVAAFDNLVLSHADRTRVIDDEHRKPVIMGTGNGNVRPTVLVDGRVVGMWGTRRVKRTAVVEVTQFGKLTARTKREVEAEARRLLAVTDPDADTTEVHYLP